MSKFKYIAFGALMALLVTGGMQMAVGQDESISQVVYACVTPVNGNLIKVANSQHSCPARTVPISWNAQGPKGDTGSQGVSGLVGEKGDQGATGPSDVYVYHGSINQTCGPASPLATMSLPAGAYLIDVTLSGGSYQNWPWMYLDIPLHQIGLTPGDYWGSSPTSQSGSAQVEFSEQTTVSIKCGELGSYNLIGLQKFTALRIGKIHFLTN